VQRHVKDRIFKYLKVAEGKGIGRRVTHPALNETGWNIHDESQGEQRFIKRMKYPLPAKWKLRKLE
jgi:hypothetical protein